MQRVVADACGLIYTLLEWLSWEKWPLRLNGMGTIAGRAYWGMRVILASRYPLPDK